MEGAVREFCSWDHMRVVIYIRIQVENIEYEMAGQETRDSNSGAFLEDKNYKHFRFQFKQSHQLL